ncbi:MAG: hypothetical protein Q7T20_13535 [Saprospiraceae bacterium]|nr:hypothetical protein [Saprospiraceae bacterium]
MWLEIVRQNPDNVVTSCTGSADVCGDKFRQVFFKVYLRTKKLVSPSDTNGLDDFYLDYSKLDVTLALKNINDPQYSHIDVTATNECFINGVGAKWYNYSNNDGDKVIFTPEEGQVSISFANLDSGADNCGSSGANNTGNIITFKHGTPDNTIACPGGSPPPECFYAELFTIVVNAYPGEFVGFHFGANGRWYEPKSSKDFCEIDSTTSGTHNGLGNIEVDGPVTFTGTANQWIEARLLEEEATTDGGYDFPVVVKNTGTVTRVVSYLEFALKATLTNFNKPFTYTGIIPRVQPGDTNLLTGETTYYLHYLIDTTLTLNAGDSVVLSKIKMGPPVLTNQRWATSLDFEDAATAPRIRSSGASEACTLLKTSGGPATSITILDAFCSDTSIHFKVKGISGGCGDLRASVELYTTDAPVTMQLKKVDFTLVFDFDTPNISFDSVEYTNWPSVICGTNGCFPPGYCYTMSSDSKTFNYCFQVSNLAPTIFSLNPSKTMELVFSSTGKGCITNVTVTKLAVTYVNTNNACIPRVEDPEDFSICANSIKGTVRTELGVGIEEVSVNVREAVFDTMMNHITNCDPTCSDSCSADFDLTDANGAYNFCDVCTTCDRFMIEPEKNDNPLNGVTTYDLVLISKHILAIEPFNTPYKMIAADATQTGSITTLDIVTIRKLILGIDTILPNNKSWRFVPEPFVFPNVNNPFQSVFPESENCVAPQSSTVDFIGIKIGDVNNTAIANRPVVLPTAGLTWPRFRIAQGGIVTLPVTYAGTEPMEAVQLGLRFDPAVLQLIGPSQGDIESYLPGNFNMLRASEGEIRTLWLPMTGEPEPVLPGTVLFYLTFKVLTDVPESGLPLWLDEQLLACSAWKPDGTEYALLFTQASRFRAEDPTELKDIQASVRPNPTLGTATLVVQAAQPEKARVMLFDGFGRRIAIREVLLAEGPQEIPLPEVQGLPGGVYVWKIYTSTRKAQGHIVKQ